jgi:hypothetical protein
VTARGWALVALLAFLVGVFAPWDRLPWNTADEDHAACIQYALIEGSDPDRWCP